MSGNLINKITNKKYTNRINMRIVYISIIKLCCPPRAVWRRCYGRTRSRWESCSRGCLPSSSRASPTSGVSPPPGNTLTPAAVSSGTSRWLCWTPVIDETVVVVVVKYINPWVNCYEKYLNIKISCVFAKKSILELVRYNSKYMSRKKTDFRLQF